MRMVNGSWLEEVRGNKAHVTDITLDKPITAQDWRLNVVTLTMELHGRLFVSITGKCMKSLDTEKCQYSDGQAAARSLGNNKVQVGFADVPAGATITVYDNQILKLRLQP